MKQFIKIGRLFYGIGIVAYGVQQLIIKDFIIYCLAKTRT